MNYNPQAPTHLNVVIPTMTDCKTVPECKEVIRRLNNVHDQFLQEADEREVTDGKSIEDLKKNLSQREKKNRWIANSSKTIK